MATLLEFPGKHGQVTIAVREPQEMVGPVGVSDRPRQRMEKSLASVLSMVASVAGSFQESLKGAPVSSGEIEFGLQFTASGTVYVVDASAAASVTVRLTVLPPSN